MTYRYTLTGKLAGRPVSLTWNDGVLSGDPEAVQALQELAACREGIRVLVPDWHQTRHNHLASPISALVLGNELLDYRCEVSGTWPTKPGLPERMDG